MTLEWISEARALAMGFEITTDLVRKEIEKKKSKKGNKSFGCPFCPYELGGGASDDIKKHAHGGQIFRKRGKHGKHGKQYRRNPCGNYRYIYKLFIDHGIAVPPAKDFPIDVLTIGLSHRRVPDEQRPKKFLQFVVQNARENGLLETREVVHIINCFGGVVPEQ